jgi:hypothetical protein
MRFLPTGSKRIEWGAARAINIHGDIVETVTYPPNDVRAVVWRKR